MGANGRSAAEKLNRFLQLIGSRIEPFRRGTVKGHMKMNTPFAIGRRSPFGSQAQRIRQITITPQASVLSSSDDLVEINILRIRFQPRQHFRRGVNLHRRAEV